MKQIVGIVLVASLSINAYSASPEIGGFHVYYGSLHNHSTVSDGSGTPAQAYAYARDVAKLDFFSLADHESYPTTGEISAVEWEDIKSQADTYNNDGSFVTFRGFEWTSSTYGDVTVINTDDIALSTTSETNTFSGFKNWLSSRDCVAFFNHPGVKNGSGLEFDHFAGPVSSKFVGIELWNKQLGFSTFYYNDGYIIGDNNKPYYDEALSLGWKVGAAGAGDHHGVNWGTSETYRLAILAENLTRADLFSALKARRFYATLDKNIALSFKINGQEMGSTVLPGTCNLRIQATDADNSESFTEVVLFDKNRNIKQVWDLNATVIDLNISIDALNGDYYYVKIKQADGDEAISSPIWIESPIITTASAETVSPAFNAIDKNPSTMWSTAWNRNLNPEPVWLQLDYTSSLVLNQMSLTFNVTESVGRAPQTFSIQASNDGGAGGNWTDLSTQSEQAFTSGETKVYTFENTNPYRYYRLYITGANTTSAIEISELAFKLVAIAADAPIITASNEAAGLPATNAIDGSTSTNWKATPGPTAAAPHWLQLQYASPQVFNKVTLTSCAYNNGEGYSSRDPRNWTIEASNDASNWTVLDTQTFSTASPAYCWAPKDDESQHEVAKQFSFTNNTAYTFYRIYITDSNQSASSVMLSEIEFSGTINGTVNNTHSGGIVYTQFGKVIVDLSDIPNACFVRIFDINGRNVASLNSPGNEKLSITIKGKGLYFVRVQNSSDSYSRKLILE